METKFFDSLFSGDSANGIKLCMGVTEGDFWARLGSVQLLYMGQDDNVDFGRIAASSNIDNDSIEVASGQPLTRWLYIARRVNCCGIEEQTLSAAARAEFDNLGNLIEQSCNKIFTACAKQTGGSKILLKWFYQPIHQSKRIDKFEIYYDNATGTIDYQNPIGSVNYAGRKFYQFVTGELVGDSYKFCIRAIAADDSDDGFMGQIIIQFNRQSPDGVSILICQTE